MLQSSSLSLNSAKWILGSGLDLLFLLSPRELDCEKEMNRLLVTTSVGSSLCLGLLLRDENGNGLERGPVKARSL